MGSTVQVARVNLEIFLDPPEDTTQEAPVAGRRSSSLATEIARFIPFTFRKSGNATVAALPERLYNLTDVPLTVRKVHLAVGTAPTGAALTVDVKINGTSVFAAAGDRAKILASAFTGEAVPTKTGDAIVLLPGQYLTAEITVIGSTVAGADLVVQVVGG
jgi:hypothetical protein